MSWCRSTKSTIRKLEPFILHEKRVIRPVRSSDAILREVCYNVIVKFTRYFEIMRQRPDRSIIKQEWIERVAKHPEKEFVQEDGRVRRWAPIPEAEGRYLRVVLLPDRETVHNAFFDRSFVP
jgi:hypothetical protein